MGRKYRTWVALLADQTSDRIITVRVVARDEREAREEATACARQDIFKVDKVLPLTEFRRQYPGWRDMV